MHSFLQVESANWSWKNKRPEPTSTVKEPIIINTSSKAVTAHLSLFIQLCELLY